MKLGDRILREEARLIILRALAEEPNESATSSALRLLLVEGFMIMRPREWVEQEMMWLEQMGAIRTIPAGTVKIATLKEPGKDHLAHRCFIAGIQRSTDPVL